MPKTIKDRGINAGHIIPVVPINQLSKAPDIPALAVETREGESVDVFIQDQTTPAFDQFFIQPVSTTTLAVDATIDTYTATVSAGHSLVDGDFIGIIGGGRAYQGVALTVVGNDLTLDTPLNFSYPAGSTVVEANREMDVNGAITRQTFVISAPTDVEVDITRIMLQMQTTDPPDFGDFGDIAGGITRGVVLRANNGTRTNYWNVKTNAEFAHLAYDYTTYDATNPAQGVNGIALRYTFAGQDKHGVAVRLAPGETLDLIIQDDLTPLLVFRLIAEGHIVED